MMRIRIERIGVLAFEGRPVKIIDGRLDPCEWVDLSMNAECPRKKVGGRYCAHHEVVARSYNFEEAVNR